MSEDHAGARQADARRQAAEMRTRQADANAATLAERVAELTDALDRFREAWWAWDGEDEALDAAAGEAMCVLGDEFVSLRLIEGRG